MTKLSVNINKIATLRNARGDNIPDLIKVALDIEKFGAQGITVHPRPDKRHICHSDVRELKKNIKTELNVEGYPNDEFMVLVLESKPAQVTLVPDKEDAITSNAGWDVLTQKDFLKKIIEKLKKNNIRTSIFLEADESLVETAAQIGTHRIELYTQKYAKSYAKGDKSGIIPYMQTAKKAKEYNLEVNAGHGLNLENISFLIEKIPQISEVSIGHALICEALYLGLENTIQCYLNKIKKVSII